jgi:hypothetical protein
VKVGDLVRYADERVSDQHLGLVLEVLRCRFLSDHPASNNVCVKWNTQRTKNLWHHVNDLEVISETR